VLNFNIFNFVFNLNIFYYLILIYFVFNFNIFNFMLALRRKKPCKCCRRFSRPDLHLHYYIHIFLPTELVSLSGNFPAFYAGGDRFKCRAGHWLIWLTCRPPTHQTTAWTSSVNHGAADSSKSLPIHYTIMNQSIDAMSLDNTATLRK
jgi:hypothetical protein